MQDNLRFLGKQIDKNQADAQGARQQAQLERYKAGEYSPDDHQADIDFHTQAASMHEQRADQLDDAVQALQNKRAEVEARVAELKAQLDTINRTALEETTRLNNEIIALQGSMTI